MEEGKNKTPQGSYEVTPASRRLYNVLVNPENYALNVTEISKKAKVSRSTYYRLMKDEEFVSWVREDRLKLLEANVENVLMANYMNAIKDEGFQDRKLYLTMSGHYAEKSEVKSEVDLTAKVDVGTTSDMLDKYLRKGDDG